MISKDDSNKGKWISYAFTNKVSMFVAEKVIEDGYTLEEAKIAEHQERFLQLEADKYEFSDPEKWPFDSFEWDLRERSQRYSLDGFTQRHFESKYPVGLLCGLVQLPDLEKVLCYHSFRGPDQLWTVGFSTCLAALIAFVANGGKPSPPFVGIPEFPKRMESDKVELMFKGGNHRYAMARGLGMTRIPILFRPEDADVIGSMVELRPISLS